MPASSLTLTTIPDGGGKSLTLELRGRALPYQGMKFTGTMRAEITRYPGNPVATVQMLGADEKPTTIKGMWKDRFIRQTRDLESGGTESITNTGIVLFNGAAMQDAKAAADAVDIIRLAGQLVKLTWDEEVRVGILTMFERNWVRREDLEWEMEFQWVSRGQEQSPPNVPIKIEAADFSRALENLVKKLKKAMNPPAFSVIEEFTRVVEQHAAEIEDASTDIKSAAQNSGSQVFSSTDANERAVTALETIKTAASSIVDTVESYPPLALVNMAVYAAQTSDEAATEGTSSSVPSSVEDLTYGNSLVADVYSRGIKTQAQAIERLAAAEGGSMRDGNQRGTLLGVFVARQPMDLREVATEFYGTSEEWRSLMSYNGLLSSKLIIGEVVLIPRLESASRGS